MKKILVLFALFCVSMLHAQTKVEYKNADTLTFFGVDYSMVRLYGVMEEPYQYKPLFREINGFFRGEPKKYDLKKFFGKKEVILSLDNTAEVNNAIDSNNLKVLNKEYKVSNEQVKEYIQGVYTGNAQGYGAILLGIMLDRPKSRGTYYIVIFDIKTRDIILSKQVEGKAAGTSYQTYWGATVLNALKQVNK